MTGFDLLQAVEQLLASRRLGEPVFVRCLVSTRDPATDPVQPLAYLAGSITRWFGVPLTRLYAAGTLAEGQISVTLQFANGATGLAVFARCPDGMGSLNILLLGNHGAAYHETPAGDACLEDTLSGPGDAHPALQSAIRRSLKAGRPELMAPEAQS
jgi:hypothetical protein